ncbi:TonB-dependent siderophore receptor [Orbus wheelerorum]|uniref:TonB-dependent siderophore receptor n=1 Tax=Orbus wheelerorum TaxID=3074111 RepID=UPI00370D926D
MICLSKIGFKIIKLTTLLLTTSFTNFIFAQETKLTDSSIETNETIYVKSDFEYATGRIKGIVATRSMLATKNDISLNKTPQSISVITRDQMDLQDASSVAQALRYSANVFTEYRGDSNRGDEIFIRGYGYAPRYLDGLNYSGTLNSRTSALDTWLLERVEVIRGPSSVLYGQASPGGIIGMTSKRPTPDTIRHIQVSMGNKRLRELNFDFGGAIEDNLLFRVNGVGRERDTQTQFVREERIAIAPSLTWMPTEATSFTLLTSYQKDPQANERNFLPKNGTIDKTNGEIPYDFAISDSNFYQSWREQYSLGYALDHDINDALTLRQNLRYTKNEQRFKYMVYTFDSGATSLFRRPQKEMINTKELTVDTRIDALFDTGIVAHSATIGFDYKWNRDDNQLERGSNGYIIDWANPQYGISIPTSDLQPFTDNLQVLKQFGIYMQDQVEIDNWNLLLSGRYDWSKIDIKQRINYGSATNQRLSIDDKAFTTRVGILYAFDNGLSPYVSYSTSFQPNAEVDINGNAFKPSKADQIELGLKYQIPNSKTLLTAAMYHLNERDVLTYDYSLYHNIQIGKVRSQGIEFEAHSELTPNIDLIASYSYANSEIKKTSISSQKGKMPARIPSHLASLWGNYKFTNGTFDGFSSGFGIRYIGTSNGNNDNTFSVPAVTLYDWILRYDFSPSVPSLSGLTLQVNANNLFNKKYVASCSGDTACFYGVERRISATINYDW